MPCFSAIREDVFQEWILHIFYSRLCSYYSENLHSRNQTTRCRARYSTLYTSLSIGLLQEYGISVSTTLSNLARTVCFHRVSNIYLLIFRIYMFAYIFITGTSRQWLICFLCEYCHDIYVLRCNEYSLRALPFP